VHTVTDPLVWLVGAPTDVPRAALTADAGALAQVNDDVVAAAAVVAGLPDADVVVGVPDELEQAARASGAPTASRARTRGREAVGIRMPPR
jgi:hypothetical protein